MSRSRSRFAVATAVSAAFITTLAVITSTPATAASHRGFLAIKGPGSLYSGTEGTGSFDGPFMSQSVAAGKVATFAVRVFNTGPALAQFKVQMETYTRYDDQVDPNVQGTLSSGSLLLTPLTKAPDGYYTKPIGPGKFEDLTYRLKVPADQPPTITSVLTLFATDGVQISTAMLRTEKPLPTTGGPQAFVSARQGSQSFIGGGFYGIQMATAPAIKLNGTAVFEVRFHNPVGDPQAIKAELGYTDDPRCSTMVAKVGNIDVTTALRNGTYQTAVLAQHATSPKMTITFRRTGATGCKAFELFSIEAKAFYIGFPVGGVLGMNVPYAVA